MARLLAINSNSSFDGESALRLRGRQISELCGATRRCDTSFQFHQDTTSITHPRRRSINASTAPTLKPSTTVLGIQLCTALHPTRCINEAIFVMAPSQRRRSIDSSSSSSDPEFSPHQSQSKKGETGGYYAQSTPTDPTKPGPHEFINYESLPPPPSYSPPSTSTAVQPPVPLHQIPPSGYRIPLGMPGPASPTSFPGIERTREAPFTDADGKSPVFIGSALLQDSVHPCKIIPSVQAQPCRIAYGGGEINHEGRYDILPFIPAHMEFVPTSNGFVPHGRQPVKGGFEQDGTELYHAVAVIDGVKVPGKTGVHLVRPRSFGPIVF